MTKRVVLAYSGGLDTSVAVRWMLDEWASRSSPSPSTSARGGDREDAMRQRALAAGAVEVEVVDAREEFARDFLVPALKANALYEGRYPLVSALSRPVIVKHLVAAARSTAPTRSAHGCTGKGNDQVRFEVSTRALAPDLEVLAPVRVWGMTREDSIRYAELHGIPITAQGEAVLDRRQPLGPRHRVRRDGGPVGRPAARRVGAHDADGDRAARSHLGFEEGVPGRARRRAPRPGRR